MSIVINNYFGKKYRRYKEVIKELDLQRANLELEFNTQKHFTLDAAFKQFFREVTSSVFKQHRTFYFWEHYRLAFCFDKQRTLASLVPLLILPLTSFTEGAALLLFLVLVQSEFFRLQSRSVNMLARDLIDFENQGITTGFLYTYQNSTNIFRCILAPVKNRKQYLSTNISRYQLKNNHLYIVFFRNEQDILFIYDLDDGYSVYSNIQVDHFRRYSVYWDTVLKEHSEAHRDELNTIKRYIINSIRRDYLEYHISLLNHKLSIRDSVTRSWLNYAISDSLFSDIMAMVERFETQENPPKGLLLFGPPGTGKTLLAKTISQMLCCHFMALSLPDIKSDSIGGSAKRIRNIWTEAKLNGPTIIFIDECEGVFKSRQDIHKDIHLDEIIQSVLAEWDGIESSDQVWLIAATNQVEQLDPAVRSRFEREINIPLPDPIGQRRILQTELLKNNISEPFPKVLIPHLKGLSGRDLANFAKQLKGAVTDGQFNIAECLRKLSQIRAKTAFRHNLNVDWDDLILRPDIKLYFQQLCQVFHNLETLLQQDYDLPESILLHGPPGTGKTQIARILACKGSLNFFSYSAAEIKGTAKGVSGNNVKRIFRIAKDAAPAILFIDEIESLLPTRQNLENDSFTTEIIANFLQEMDGIGKGEQQSVLVIAASNYPEQIDAAILSRFSNKIAIELPMLAEREAMFQLFLKTRKTAFDKQKLCSVLALNSDGLSGRDIKNRVAIACQNAVNRAIKENQIDNITLNLQDFESDLNPQG